MPTLHRLDPAVYDRIVDSGALAEEPVELVDGLLIHVRRPSLSTWRSFNG